MIEVSVDFLIVFTLEATYCPVSCNYHIEYYTNSSVWTSRSRVPLFLPFRNGNEGGQTGWWQADWPHHHLFRLKTSWWMHIPVSCINTASDRQIQFKNNALMHKTALELELCEGSSLYWLPSGCAISDHSLQSNLSTPASPHPMQLQKSWTHSAFRPELDNLRELFAGNMPITAKMRQVAIV